MVTNKLRGKGNAMVPVMIPDHAPFAATGIRVRGVNWAVWVSFPAGPNTVAGI